MSDKAPSRVLFVGNIPYELSDEQVYDIMKSMGPVSRFRLVHDQKTSRSKGYGFVEFATLDVAITACKNIQTLQIGTRTLRADFTKEFTGVSVIPGAGGPVSSGQSNNRFGGYNNNNNNNNNNYGGYDGGNNDDGFKRGKKDGRWQKKGDFNNNQQFQNQYNNQNNYQRKRDNYQQQQPQVRATLEAEDPISKSLSQVKPEQLIEFFSTIPDLVAQNPDQVSMILHSQPALAYASFQALLLMGITDEDVIAVLASDPAMSLQTAISKIRETKAGKATQSDNSGSSGGRKAPSASDNDPRRNAGSQNAPPRQNSSYDPRQNSGSSNYDPRQNSSSNSSYDPRQNNNAKNSASFDPRQNASFDPRQNRRNNNANNANNKKFQKNPQYNDSNGQQYQNQGNQYGNGQSGGSGMDGGNAAILSQVMQLSEEQIRSLPEDQQNTIRMLKANYLGQN